MIQLCAKNKCPRRIRWNYAGEDGILVVCNTCQRMQRKMPVRKKQRVRRIGFSLAFIALLTSLLAGLHRQQGAGLLSLPIRKSTPPLEGRYNCMNCEGNCRLKQIRIYDLQPGKYQASSTFSWDLVSEGNKGKGLRGQTFEQDGLYFALLLQGERDTFGLFELYTDNAIQKLNHQTLRKCIFKKSYIQ